MSVIHSLDKHIEGSQKHNNEQKKLEQKCIQNIVQFYLHKSQKEAKLNYIIWR